MLTIETPLNLDLQLMWYEIMFNIPEQKKTISYLLITFSRVFHLLKSSIKVALTILVWNRSEQQSKIIAIGWYDTRSVTMLSTYIGPEPVDKVRRWDKSRKEFVEVQRPLIVSEYNLCMGGFDLLDSFWQNTGIQRSQKDGICI